MTPCPCCHRRPDEVNGMWCRDCLRHVLPAHYRGVHCGASDRRRTPAQRTWAAQYGTPCPHEEPTHAHDPF